MAQFATDGSRGVGWCGVRRTAHRHTARERRARRTKAARARHTIHESRHGRMNPCGRCAPLRFARKRHAGVAFFFFLGPVVIGLLRHAARHVCCGPRLLARFCPEVGLSGFFVLGGRGLLGGITPTEYMFHRSSRPHTNSSFLFFRAC